MISQAASLKRPPSLINTKTFLYPYRPWRWRRRQKPLNLASWPKSNSSSIEQPQEPLSDQIFWSTSWGAIMYSDSKFQSEKTMVRSKHSHATEHNTNITSCQPRVVRGTLPTSRSKKPWHLLHWWLSSLLLPTFPSVVQREALDLTHHSTPLVNWSELRGSTPWSWQRNLSLGLKMMYLDLIWVRASRKWRGSRILISTFMVRKNLMRQVVLQARCSPRVESVAELSRLEWAATLCSESSSAMILSVSRLTWALVWKASELLFKASEMSAITWRGFFMKMVPRSRVLLREMLEYILQVV